MTTSLDRLPFDVLFHISSSLQFDDILHLSYTCRQLRLLLQESTLCRKTIEAHAPHSKEARLARERRITYGQAIQSVYDRRNAFSNAYPFSARILGEGTAFLCRQGVLCILHGSIIRIMGVHFTSEAFGIDLHTVINPLPSSSSEDAKFTLLYLSDGIVAVLYERNKRQNSGRILAINANVDASKGERLIKEIPLESTYKLFVRHTSAFLYYGTYTGVGQLGHHEWEIRRVSLAPGHDMEPWALPIQLEGFFGTDIGPTIAFEIHNNYFYAVSNQTSFDVEELDWTSFYHCVRFPLDRPYADALEVNDRVYRRQHAEGPINDSWTDLSIQIDECTNEPVIVESRREWQNGSSRQLRTFYITEINFNPDSTTSPTGGSPSIEPTNEPLLPEDDPFTELLDSENKPNYAPPKPRHSWNSHPEFGSNSGTSRSFILARTKFRAYNYSCSSFIDLVEDERCCGDPLADPCLRIRIGSRRVAPLDWSGSCPDDKSGSSAGPSASTTATPGDEVYRHSSIKIWPPAGSQCPCSKQLHKILNPRRATGTARGNRTVTGVVDERSLVYMVKSAKTYGADDNALGTIVLVNFNRDMIGASTARQQPNDADQNMEVEDSLPEWHWTPGHYARCQRGEC